jgi:hypothetical protein
MSLTDTAPRTGTTTDVPSAAAPPSGLPPTLGGTRGLIDGGLPPLHLVTVNAVAGTQTTGPTGAPLPSNPWERPCRYR